MDKQKTLDKVIAIFADVMDVDPRTIGSATTPEDVESWDSVSHVRLIMSVEKAFAVKFTNAQIGKLRSVGDIAGALIHQ
jgi:acyl carrier protein